jgi:UDPglucose 6-dehydrogenase
MRITTAVHDVNQDQHRHFAQKILEHYNSDLRGRTLALWGLTYKAGTDDVRESPAIVVALALCEAGAKVRAHDPHGMAKARAVLPRDVEYFEDAHDAAAGAGALVVLTSCPEFRNPDLDRLKASLAEPVIFDGRNLYDPWLLAKRGFTYIAVGRPVIPPDATRASRPGKGERL